MTMTHGAAAAMAIFSAWMSSGEPPADRCFAHYDAARDWITTASDTATPILRRGIAEVWTDPGTESQYPATLLVVSTDAEACVWLID